ncbi:MAG: YicC family protein [Cellvibrionales bacterium]|nr:YicC family protein [Cellvibrionales bacterium]
MPYSMTGFAQVIRSTPWGEISCELRSVNHRYLDLSFKLAKDVRPLETDIRQLLKAHLNRGKLDCVISVDLSEAAEGGVVDINHDYLTALLSANAEVFQKMGVAAEEKASTFLAWPGVIAQNRQLPENFNKEVMAVLSDSIEQLQLRRLKEGNALAVIMCEKLDAMEQITQRCQANYANYLKLHLNKLRDKVDQLKTEIDDNRLEQELVILSQKADISEELDRLMVHIKSVRSALNNEKPSGRRLDFLMQELNREANTLGSKSMHIELTEASVELKVLIEQIREQVQNIE